MTCVSLLCVLKSLLTISRSYNRCLATLQTPTSPLAVASRKCLLSPHGNRPLWRTISSRVWLCPLTPSSTALIVAILISAPLARTSVCLLFIFFSFLLMCFFLFLFEKRHFYRIPSPFKCLLFIHAHFHKFMSRMSSIFSLFVMINWAYFFFHYYHSDRSKRQLVRDRRHERRCAHHRRHSDSVEWLAAQQQQGTTMKHIHIRILFFFFFSCSRPL